MASDERAPRKVGRNEPCPCGSGRKYKKCHLRLDMRERRNRMSIRPSRSSMEGGVLTGRPFIDAEHQGYRFRAVGGRLYWGPPSETFHEFVLRLLREHLTNDWIQGELDKDTDSQHLIVRWFLEKDDLFSNKAEDHGEGIRSILMTGGVKSLLALGYDIYSLRHTGEILPKLVNRLKHRDQFQGVRYEMAVAGLRQTFRPELSPEIHSG
jgi:hypothetical protein